MTALLRLSYESDGAAGIWACGRPEVDDTQSPKSFLWQSLIDSSFGDYTGPQSDKAMMWGCSLWSVEDRLPAQEHPSFRWPLNRSAILWRYMGLDKLVWALDNRALFFCRSDKFEDPSEGFFTRANALAEDHFVSYQMRNGGFGAPERTSAESLRQGYRMMLSVAQQDRTNTFVSCWHMNENESDAMWNRYAPTPDSISVQTSFAKLQQLLPDQCYLGGINYIDFDTELIDLTNSLNAIVHKERKYAGEREIRAVVWGRAAAGNFPAIGENGIAVPVDLNALVEKVYLHPLANPSCRQRVANLLDRYGLISKEVSP
ncbi:hypothetical protein AAFG07_32215 [Bradyrhizobium sp. B097]|uniref:hypothetical protein n=1 Tax=Bradyrhizobium sp. B097 TaxID=3140244 RepID=UPI0031844FBD